MNSIDVLYTEEGKVRLKQAIEQAELCTSGEIRLHIDKFCKGNVLDRAAFIFEKLEMHNTELRNGVLFYVASSDKKFAILGDKGINEKVPADFWNRIKDGVIDGFQKGNFLEALSWGIEQAGLSLQHFFPRSNNDVNELTDDISFE